MTTDSSHDSDIPKAIAGQSRWSLFLIWLIPVVAALIGAGLAARAIMERGPTIVISFKTAEGLEAGKTQIKYKNVDMGEVKNIRLSDDHSTVLVTAQMTKQAESFLVKDTRFWIVRPRITGGSVSGLNTLLSGAYIGIDPGKAKDEQEYFVGLETPPIVTGDLPGREFVLHGDNLGSLDIGSPVFFRRVEVGRVVAYQLDKDGKGVTLRIFINAPYDVYVRTNTQFWHASGFDVALDSGGIKVNVEALSTLVIAGVAFEAPPDATPASAAEVNRAFRLSSDRTEAMKSPDIVSETYVMNFKESVRGLGPGAPVDFRGIVIGEVASVGVDYDVTNKAFTIPVEIKLYPERLRAKYRNGTSAPNPKHILDRFVERGFRGQLRVGNLLTQQLYIALDFFPDAPKARMDWSKTPAELPTVPGTAEELQASLARILKKLEKVPLQELSNDLRNTLRTLDGTLKTTDKLMKRVDGEVVPEVRSTLDSTRKALSGIEGALNADAPLQQDMRDALRELTRAAQALRTLADYLERHPESIIRGKKEDQP